MQIIRPDLGSPSTRPRSRPDPAPAWTSLSDPVVVTGAASGIGAATAALVAEAGAPVALLDRDAATAETLAARLRAAGAKALALACDVTEVTQIDAAFAAATAELGELGGVVACAGIDRAGPAHDLPIEDFDSVLAVNLRGTFLTCRAALRAMLPAGRGSIVCVSSPFAFVSAPGGTGAYSASKGGVSALVRSLAVDYGAQGIRVNALLPGPTDTELMWASVPPERVDEARAVVGREVPLGRLADPREPAQAALWLLSDASSYVTGAQLACDGGVLARASISV